MAEIVVTEIVGESYIEVDILAGQGPSGDAGGGGGTPGGSNTQVQFNDASAFGGDAGLTYNKTTDTLTAGNLALTNALPVAQGGSGATTAAGARNAFGLMIGTDVQAYNVNLNAFSGLVGAADKVPYFTAVGALSTFTATSFFRTIADDADAGTVRTTLGLGSAATQSSAAFEAAGAVTAGIAAHVALGDPHAQYALESALAAIAASGSASDLTAGTLSIARLADGSVTLAKIANIATARLLGRNTAGSGVIEELTAATVRTMLSLVPGTDVQAYDADLAAIAGLTSTADKGIQFTGVGTAATFDLTTAGKAILDDADASAQRVTLALDVDTTELGAIARSRVRKNSTGTVFKRRQLNLIEGSGVTITMADDAGNEEVDVTIAASAGSGIAQTFISPINAAVGASTDQYLQLGGNTLNTIGNEARIRTYIPVAGTVSKMYVWINQASNSQPASGSLVITIYKNNATAGPTITIAASTTVTTLQTDLSTTLSVSAGDYLHIRVQNNATANSCNINNITFLYA